MRGKCGYGPTRLRGFESGCEITKSLIVDTGVSCIDKDKLLWRSEI